MNICNALFCCIFILLSSFTGYTEQTIFLSVKKILQRKSSFSHTNLMNAYKTFFTYVYKTFFTYYFFIIENFWNLRWITDSSSADIPWLKKTTFLSKEFETKINPLMCYIKILLLLRKLWNILWEMSSNCGFSAENPWICTRTTFFW